MLNLQKEALKQAKKSIPEGRWWIKADGCDVRKGLRESMRGIWSGDEDLGDGSLRALYDDYKARCAFVRGIGTPGRSRVILNDVACLLVELQKDLEFLSTGADAANGVYNRALQGGRSSDHTLMELAWAVVGFEELVKKVRNFQVELGAFEHGDSDGAIGNLMSLKSGLLVYLKDLYTKKRTAASHMLVFMIADELRNRKPYAIPVRFMPYRSLTDSKMRELELQLEEAMRNMGMTVVGMYLVNCYKLAVPHIIYIKFTDPGTTPIALCS